MQQPNLTLAITSKQRHDLLRQTLISFIKYNKPNPKCLITATLILEDSPLRAPRWLNNIHLNIAYINNIPSRGHIYSCDRLMQLVETEWVMWLEDDWEFISPGYIEQSIELLTKYKDVFTVSLRGEDNNNHPVVADSRFPFNIYQPYWLNQWGGFTFNPGVRRLSDYRKLGPYGQEPYNYNVNHEALLSIKYLNAGYVIAVPTKSPVIKHLGFGRSKLVEGL